MYAYMSTLSKESSDLDVIYSKRVNHKGTIMIPNLNLYFNIIINHIFNILKFIAKVLVEGRYMITTSDTS